MGLISINDLQPGMVLAAEVNDRSGRMLLAAGNEITEKHLRIFKRWGVVEVDVAGTDQASVDQIVDSETDAVALEEAERRADDLFRHTAADDPVIRELRRLAVRRMTRGGAEVHHES